MTVQNPALKGTRVRLAPIQMSLSGLSVSPSPSKSRIQYHYTRNSKKLKTP